MRPWRNNESSTVSQNINPTQIQILKIPTLQIIQLNPISTMISSFHFPFFQTKSVFFFVLVVLFTHQLAFAQKFSPGYVIKMNGDSIKGQVFLEYKNGSVKRVHLKSTNQEQLFGPSDIKAAGSSTATIFSK